MTQPPTPPYGERDVDRPGSHQDPVKQPPVVDEWVSVADSARSTTDSSSSPTPGNSGTSSKDSGTKDAAKQEASEVKDTAVEAGQEVVGTAKDQAQNVATEATQQGKQLLQQTKTELGDQASSQQQRLAGTLSSYSQQLGSMASSSDHQGLMTNFAQQASRRGGEVADWLGARDPKDLLTDVQGFARRRPVAFLALAATAGVLAGRLTRGLAGDAKSNADQGQGRRAQPAVGTGGGPTSYATNDDTRLGAGRGQDDSYARPSGQAGLR